MDKWEVAGKILQGSWEAAKHSSVFLWNAGGACLSSAWDAAGNLTIDDQELEQLHKDVQLQKEQYQEIVETGRERYDRWRQPDAMCVGGTVLADLLGGWWIFKTPVPENIDRAYNLAYPQMAAEVPFREAARAVANDPERLTGFISGVKGKLFELQYADQLNHGLLPEGFHADLARSATQPGWDIQIMDAHGQVIDHLQAKATDSMGYVHQALAQHPHIDVVTTDEVYHNLLLGGAGDHVVHSGILDSGLTHHVQSAVEAQGTHDHWIPEVLPHLPVTTLALAAFTTYSFDRGDVLDKTARVGERVGGAYPAYLAAHIVSGVLSGGLGLVASMATGIAASWFISKGRQRRMIYGQLLAAKGANATVMDKLRMLAARPVRLKHA